MNIGVRKHVNIVHVRLLYPHVLCNFIAVFIGKKSRLNFVLFHSLHQVPLKCIINANDAHLVARTIRDVHNTVSYILNAEIENV